MITFQINLNIKITHFFLNYVRNATYTKTFSKFENYIYMMIRNLQFSEHFSVRKVQTSHTALEKSNFSKKCH